MAVAIITGSGTYALPGLEEPEALTVTTPFGPAELSRGGYAGSEVLHVSRHGVGHVRLSNHVTHRANIWAIKELGAEAALGCTACGALDPALELGSLIVFDDLHFISNRLADGSLCTFSTEPGAPSRAHWILHGGPYSTELREILVAAAGATGHGARDGGTYGHVDGPRFNTPSEIAQLRSAGVAAVSQTGGPEAVLCGELELPFALMGFVTDYANEIKPGETTPVEELIGLMSASPAVFAEVLAAALPRVVAGGSTSPGSVYRIGEA
jgi:5'-methylthioadenosine phosphorylase